MLRLLPAQPLADLQRRPSLVRDRRVEDPGRVIENCEMSIEVAPSMTSLLSARPINGVSLKAQPAVNTAKF